MGSLAIGSGVVITIVVAVGVVLLFGAVLAGASRRASGCSR
jgi:hypothetical protein